MVTLCVHPRDDFLFNEEQDGCQGATPCKGAVPFLIIFTSSHSLHNTMNSSYATDVFTQSSQFRPATYQPGPTRIYQNPNSAPPNVAHPAPPPSQPQAPPSRPHSIAELAERAKLFLGEDPKPFKAWLRIAENARRDAKSFYEQGDLELAFVEYAKAATIVLEKIPAHPDYRVLLSTTQRHNMGLVSYLYLIGPHDRALVGRLHPSYECIDKSIFRVLHGCHLV
jgi:ubiquitin carboxyl-terminal hydrolase-like protein